jgi:DNA-binding NarL/FixJ family response regulator
LGGNLTTGNGANSTDCCSPPRNAESSNPSGPGGLETVRHIRQWDRSARILIFTTHASAAFALKAIEAGVNGYITKSSAPPELVRAIATVAKGGRALSEDTAREVAAERLSGQRSLVEDLGRAKPRSSGWSRRAGPRKRSLRRSI